MSAPPSNGLVIATAEGPGSVVIRLRGELDVATTPEFDAELARLGDANPPTVVVDLSELEFMDSTGLRAILGAHERAGQSGARFALIQGPRQVERLLSLTRVAERLEIVSRLEELVGPGRER